MTRKLETTRLQEALLRNRRRLALPDFCRGLKRALGSPADVSQRLIDLEESLDFEESFDDKLAELRREDALEELRTQVRERLQEETDRIFTGAQDVEFWVLLSNWRKVGAVRITGRELLHRLLRLLEWDGDTVFGGTQDLRSVFMFDLAEGYEGRRIYEVIYGPGGASGLAD